ncbi:MAG: 4-hydroxy-3-methylbut-2-enyl diphosphate reductase [Verrucomicrobiales bacterium]|nr:4-hydroxy-3-methylbut-2-enyl diphosphate reductase [Verrucomicrobiales bacterium]
MIKKNNSKNENKHFASQSELKIIKSEHMGMCFGVRDAIKLVNRVANERPLTVLGELVHNSTVLNTLSNRGVKFANKPEDVMTETVMITAHGTSNQTRRSVMQQGLQMQDATCPLVHYAHKQIHKLIENGCHPVIIGRNGHVEVLGLTDDLVEYDVVLNEQDIDKINFHKRFGVIAQTTQPISHVQALVKYLKSRFPKSKVRFVDTVCQPTKQRQRAAEELAMKSDVVLVIGGLNSNNSKELAKTCAKFCANVYHIQSPDDIQITWLDTAKKLGITAGTSTPNEHY